MLSPNRSTPLASFGLRSKFILAFAIQTIIVAVMIVSIEQYRVRQTIVAQTIEHGTAIASTIDSTAGYYVLFGLNDDLKKIVEDLRRNPSVEYADFTGSDGKPLAASSPIVPPV